MPIEEKRFLSEQKIFEFLYNKETTYKDVDALAERILLGEDVLEKHAEAVIDAFKNWQSNENFSGPRGRILELVIKKLQQEQGKQQVLQ